MKIVALIPLRGGSKSIPYKNIMPLAGQPLCWWSLQAAAQSKFIDEVWVSTEDLKIKQVVESFNLGIKVLDRPAELAQDTSSTESVMLHFAEQLDFDLLVTIQATSPLITAELLDDALKYYQREGFDTLLSVVEWRRFLWKKDGHPLNYDPTQRPRRQEMEPLFLETGSFYITPRSLLLEQKCRLGGRIGLYVLPSEFATEIDEPADREYVEFLLRRQSRRAFSELLKNIKLLLLDVDGVLTDAGMYYSAEGEFLKKFNTRDGHGISMLKQYGVRCGVITREDSKVTLARVQKLGIDIVKVGQLDKEKALKEIAEGEGLSLSQIAYIGDDLFDIPVLERVGFSASPADAVPEVKRVVKYVCENRGGQGCVREVCDLIIEAKGS